ncbi:hypothetical protein [Mycolicibacterium sp.]|nr:hypothetical protein [Mycolicibacterium sp.]
MSWGIYVEETTDLPAMTTMPPPISEIGAVHGGVVCTLLVFDR